MKTRIEAWQSFALVFADAVRVLALVSALVTIPNQPLEVPLRFLGMFVLLMLTRSIGMPRPFEAAFASLLLISGWCSALSWYFEHHWIDIPIHFALTGATAAMLYFALARQDLLPKPEDPLVRTRGEADVLIVTLLGGTVSVVWEIYEWVAERTLPSRILVGYDDSIGDMTNGLLGSVVAGYLVSRWVRAGHRLHAEKR